MPSIEHLLTEPTEPADLVVLPGVLHGWASTNYTLSEDPPAVLINPEADALTLLSWGFGQLQQCNAVLDALSAASRDMPETSAQGVDAVLHFSAQAEQVLKVGIERLRRAPPVD